MPVLMNNNGDSNDAQNDNESFLNSNLRVLTLYCHVMRSDKETWSNEAVMCLKRHATHVIKLMNMKVRRTLTFTVR